MPSAGNARPRCPVQLLCRPRGRRCRGVSRRALWIQWTSLGESGADMSDDSILTMRMQGQGLLSDGGGTGDQTSKYNSCPNPALSAVSCEAQPHRRRAPTRPSLPHQSRSASRHGAPPLTSPHPPQVQLQAGARPCGALACAEACIGPGHSATRPPPSRASPHTSGPHPFPPAHPLLPVRGRRPTRSGASRR